MRYCTIEGCGRPHNSKGLCAMHEWRFRNHGRTESRRERLLLEQQERDLEHWKRHIKLLQHDAPHDLERLEELAAKYGSCLSDELRENILYVIAAP